MIFKSSQRVKIAIDATRGTTDSKKTSFFCCFIYTTSYANKWQSKTKESLQKS